MNMSFENMKDTILDLQEENYDDFVKELISLEKGIDNKEVMDEIYDKYMDDDEMREEGKSWIEGKRHSRNL